ACEILFSANAPQFLYVWLGSNASEDVKEAAMNHATQLGESAAVRPSIVLQGEEPQEYHEVRRLMRVVEATPDARG
ncbi:hypothetical protein H632_c3288p0, partial [Helicosporidium sp. ATCC 50920]